MEETTYKVEFDFDGYKNNELLVQCFIIISTVFTNCMECPFSVSFPSIVESDGWTRNIEIEMKSSRPLIYKEYKSLSQSLHKLNWACFIKDQDNSISTMIRRESYNMENEMIIGEFL
jgi:hypothetical protein